MKLQRIFRTGHHRAFSWWLQCVQNDGTVWYFTCMQLCICNSYVDDFTHLRQTWIFFQCLIKKMCCVLVYVQIGTFSFHFIDCCSWEDWQWIKKKQLCSNLHPQFLCSILIKLLISDAINEIFAFGKRQHVW